MFNRVVIVGVGQIGASIGLNVVSKHLAREVIGVGRSEKNLREAVRRRSIHRSLKTDHVRKFFQELTDQDLVILATPVETAIDYLKKISKKPLIIDVGSTKEKIVREARRRRLRFIGCHPIAGTEKGGAEAGQKDLFQNRLCLISSGSSKDLSLVKNLWKKLGATPVPLDAKTHDRIFAAVSHLPHLVAYSLIQAVSRRVTPREIGRFAFESLKGMTRIAASPPEMWRDIFLQNRRNLIESIDVYLKELSRLRSYIGKKDPYGLLTYLHQSQRIRRRITC